MDKGRDLRVFPKTNSFPLLLMVVLAGLFRIGRTRERWDTPFSDFSGATLVSACRDYDGIATHPSLKVDPTSVYEGHTR